MIFGFHNLHQYTNANSLYVKMNKADADQSFSLNQSIHHLILLIVSVVFKRGRFYVHYAAKSRFLLQYDGDAGETATELLISNENKSIRNSIIDQMFELQMSFV